MKLYKILVACLLLTGISTHAHAINVIDQLQDQVNNSHTGFVVLDLVETTVQSFQQTNDNISGAGIKLHATTALSSANLSIALWNALPGTLGAVELAIASGSIDDPSDSNDPTVDGWFDLFWTTPFSTTANTTYYLVFDSDDQNSGLLGSEINPYSFGEHFHDHGVSAGLSRFSHLSGTAYNSGLYDTTFRTYTSVVPVPTAVWLFGTGLLGLMGVRRKSTVISV